MARLSASTIYGKLKATGEAIINGALRVKNGLRVEGGEIDQYATIQAGENADSGHLMIESNGGNLYLNRTDNGNTRIYNGKIEDSLDINDKLLYNVSSLRDNNANCELVFDDSNNRFEFEDGNGARTEALFSRIYLDNSNNWFNGSHGSLSNVSSNDHHDKYTDSDAVSAVESGTFNELAFNNIEDPSTNRSIGIDDSEGILFKNGSGNTYPVYTNESVSIGTDLDRSGGSGAGSTPITISHADTSSQGNVSASGGNAITDINLDGRGHVTSIGTSSVGGNTFSQINLTDADGDGNNWVVTEDGSNGHLNFNSSGGGGTQMDIEHNGNVRIEGTITENSSL